MEFLIRRTSDYSDGKPCTGAKRKSFVHIDRRTVKTLEQARKSAWGEHFFASGTNHREEKVGACGVARDLPAQEHWTIEVETLADLVALVGKVGDIVIHSPLFDLHDAPELEIEIYDGYRE